MYRRGAISPVAVGPVLPSLLAVLLALTFGVAAWSASADTEPHLLLDIHDGPPADLGSDPELLGSLAGGRVVLAATDPVHGREPWVTDGTAEGTFLLADIVPGPASSGIEPFRSASTANRVFFTAQEVPRSGEGALWVSDGTAAGTSRLVGALRGTAGPDVLRTDGEGRAFLLALDLSGAGLWVSDGSPAGTRRLPYAALPGQWAGTFVGVLGNRVLFVAGTGIGGTQELWASDGSATGTRRLLPEAVAGPPFYSPFSGFQPIKFHAAALTDGTAVVFQDLGKELEPDVALALWRTDGTPEGTHQERVLDGVSLLPLSTLEGPRVVFSTWGVSEQTGLWMTDGTAAGTRRVFEQAMFSSTLQWLGERLLFTVGGPSGIAGDETGSELWAVDAGDPSAHRVTELPGIQLGLLIRVRGGVACVAQSIRSDLELWWSDGTAAGTRRVASLGISDYYRLIAATVELAGTEELALGFYREEVWDLFASDGTAAGTRHLARFDLSEGEVFSETLAYMPVEGGLLFGATDSAHGREPWITDGTAEGTHLVLNVSAVVGTGDAWPQGLTRYRDTLVFFARDASGWGLWQTDGSGPGSHKVRDLHFQVPPNFRPDFDGPKPLALAGDRLFFIVPTADSRVDLKVADLAAGQVRHLGRFSGRSPPRGEGAVALGDRLLWATGLGKPLVVSDGTLEGTRELPLRFAGMVGGLAVLPGGPALVVAYEVSAEDEPLHYGLWRTDGTAAGSWPLLESEGGLSYADLTPVADGLAYFAYDEQTGGSSSDGDLWRTDGTPEGTARVDSFGGARPTDLTSSTSGLFFFRFDETIGGVELWLRPSGGGPSRRLLETTPDGLPLWRIEDPTSFGSRILFFGFDEFHGLEPWVSDGTPEGTRLLVDVVPGAASPVWERVATLGTQAFLFASGRIWRTDGTAAGTFAVAGEPPAGIPSGELAGLGDRLLYVGTTFETGRELWVVPVGDLQPPPPPPPPSPPAAPFGLTASASSSEIYLRWATPADDLLYFQIEARTAADGSFEPIARSRAYYSYGFQQPLVWSQSLSGLSPGVPYAFRVRAVNAAGVSPPSNEATAFLVEDAVIPCQPSATALCLLDGRFEFSVWWRDPRTGDFGQGRAVPFADTDLSGTFWFFDPANVELIVKALDGTAVNRRWWVFTGGLTDVEYWLRAVDLGTDTENRVTPSAVRWYHHPPPSLCGFADTDAFAGEPGTVFPLPAGSHQGEPPATELDLLGARYRVSVDWHDLRSGDTGVGRAIPGSDNTGYFWFFLDGNVELVVKVIDGTPVNGHRWVFYGGLTDVEYTLHVTELATGVTRDYDHAAGDLCGGSDTRAFQASAAPP